jgi:DNA repair exonuclease SbcCD ATPase subunit
MKLKKLEIKSGGGISPSSPVVIDFSQSNFVKLGGDNGVGKSSVLESFLLALGEIGGKKVIDKLTNLESGGIDIDLTFSAERKDFHVRATKSTFKLTYEGETAALPEPMTMLRRLLGPTGVSPMEVKNKPINEIVKWLAAYSTKNPEEFEKALQKNKDGVKKAQDSRAQANRSAKGIVEYLVSEGMANEKGEIVESKWTAAEKKYGKKVDVKALSLELTEAGKASDKVIQYESAVKELEKQETALVAQIEELQARLADTRKRLENGRKHVEENKGAKKKYDEVKARYDRAAAEAVAYEGWQDVKRKKAELDEFQQIAQSADATEKQLLKERAEMQAEILPDIKGVELVLEDTHEDGKPKKAGLYRNGVDSVKMSVGEFFKMVIEMFRKNKNVKILVIDNAEQLGSDPFKLLEELAARGCYILIGEVNRGKKELELSYV